MTAPDTIVAAATPAGRGGIAGVRLSGAQVPAIARALLGSVPRARLATPAAFRDANGQVLDHGLALYFPAPHSYTGEHVLELHAHGAPVLIEALIQRCLALGARRAQPGEFTQRAFLNGKLDLAQAEAVADLIDAASASAARAAVRSLQGEFSQRVGALHEALGTLRAAVEAAIDFADEHLEFLSEQALGGRLEALLQHLRALLRTSRSGRALTEGLTLVIAGRPNAGKSTLLNRLAGHEAAIVTDIPGTTRDILRERIVIDGVPLQILDTAGLRGPGDHSEDPIEQEGMRRALAAMARADRIVFVVDSASDPTGNAYREEQARLPPDVPVTCVFNKADLVGASHAVPPNSAPTATFAVSALSGAGLDALREHLVQCAGLDRAEEGVISARARHIEALQRAEQQLLTAAAQLRAGRTPELVAEELRRAQHALGEITGIETTEELLGRIFATFCIGK